MVESLDDHEEVRSGCKIEIFWPDDQLWYPGTVGVTGADGKRKIEYDDGEIEFLELSKEKYRLPTAEAPTLEPTWRTAMLAHWSAKLGDGALADEAAEMQAAALRPSTAGNYEAHWKTFVDFCLEEGLPWLPATEGTVLKYIAFQKRRGTVRGSSLQPYLSAINNFHEDFGHDGPAKGRAVTRAVRGMTAMQTEAEEEQGCSATERTWLPAAAVRRVHQAADEIVVDSRESLELLRSCVYVVVAFVTFGRPQTGTAMLRESLLRDSSGLSVVLQKEKGRNHTRTKRRLRIPVDGVKGLHELLELWETARDDAWLNDAPTRTSGTAGTASYWRLPWESGKHIKASEANVWIGNALQHVGRVPPEGGHYSAHSTRKGAATCARAVGVTMEKVCYFGGWSQLSSAVLAYIDPTAVVDNDMTYYFGWLAPGWKSALQDSVE